MTKPASPAAPEIVVRPFADWLREQAKGKSHDELGESLNELVARVRDTGKKGSMTYTIVVEPNKGTTAITVHDEIRLKLPEHDRDASLYFVDRNNNLTRNDPNQMTFESLREVPPPPGIDPATGEVLNNAKDA